MSETLVLWATTSPRLTQVSVKHEVSGTLMTRILVLEWVFSNVEPAGLSAGAVMHRMKEHLARFGADGARLSGFDRDKAMRVWPRARETVLGHWPGLAREIPAEMP